MSGEKVGKWRLAEPGDPTAMSWEQANQILAEYQAKAEALRCRLAELAAQHPDLGVKYTQAEPEGDPPATVEALAKALNDIQDRYNERYFELPRVEESIEKKRLAELAAEQKKRIDAILSRATDRAGEARWQALRNAVPEAVQKLRSDADPAAQAAIERTVQEAMSLQSRDVAQLEELVKTVKQTIGTANNEARAKEADGRRQGREREERANDSREAMRLITELVGAKGAEATEVLSNLQRVERGEVALSHDLKTRAERTITELKQARATDAEHLKAADRGKVRDILGSMLVGLGYKLGSDFATAFAHQGGEATLHRPEWKNEGYYCRIRVDPKTQEISLRMACEGKGPIDRDRDRKVDAAWCSSMGELQKRVAAKGLELPISAHPPADGELVEHVAPRAEAVRVGKGAGIAIARRLPGQ